MHGSDVFCGRTNLPGMSVEGGGVRGGEGARGGGGGGMNLSMS